MENSLRIGKLSGAEFLFEPKDALLVDDDDRPLGAIPLGIVDAVAWQVVRLMSLRSGYDRPISLFPDDGNRKSGGESPGPTSGTTSSGRGYSRRSISTRLATVCVGGGFPGNKALVPSSIQMTSIPIACAPSTSTSGVSPTKIASAGAIPI
jgi:hypothetical protein